MKRLLLAILLLLLVLPFNIPAHATGGEHTTMTGLPHDIYYMQIHLDMNWYYYQSYNQKSIQALYALNGPNLWIGYDRGAWDVPDGTTWLNYIEIYSRTRKEPYYLFIASSSSTPKMRYLFLFDNLKANCDSKGQHCGNHMWIYDTSSGVKLATIFSVDTDTMRSIYRLSEL